MLGRFKIVLIFFAVGLMAVADPRLTVAPVALAKYGLRAGVDGEGTNGVAYLLYTPKSSGRRPVPMVVYLPGRGGRGNIGKLFANKTIFARVTSEAFQREHPCYLLALAPPVSATTLLGGFPERPSRQQRRLHDAVLRIAGECVRPAVDTNRLYLTGYSYGGNGVYGLALHYPGLFAASVPIAALPPQFEYFSPDRPGCWWHFHNEGDYSGHGLDVAELEKFRDAVNQAGGDFRIGVYPATGHDAWTKAWREDEVWRWMFSKSLATDALKERRAARPSISFADARCSATRPGRDSATTPQRVIDGLSATCYVSDKPFGREDWWRIDFPTPVAGHFRLVSGNAARENMFGGGVVEVSADGRRWMRAGAFGVRTGVCAFTQKTPVTAMRVRNGTSRQQLLVLRSLSVVPLAGE